MTGTQTLVATLVVGGIIIGANLALRSATRERLYETSRADAVAACGEDPACIATVAAHFDACFEEHYDPHRRSGGEAADGVFSGESDHEDPLPPGLVEACLAARGGVTEGTDAAAGGSAR